MLNDTGLFHMLFLFTVRTRQEKNRRTGAFTICEAQTLRESTLRRPKGQGRLGDRAKTKEDVHFWYLCRAMRCLRYFEMQWGFVNAQVESSIQEYKQKVRKCTNEEMIQLLDSDKLLGIQIALHAFFGPWTV